QDDLPKSTIDTTFRRAESPPLVLPVPLHPSGLPYFGYDLFQIVPDAFAPNASGPVDPEYVLGPGDVVRVAVWGQVEFEREYSVDQAGRIFVSTVGQVLVAGLTLEGMYEKLLRQMSRSYSGLLTDPPTIWLDVTLARLKPKRIFVMGEVKAPGGYTVSSYATMFNSLYSVGGPTVQGSLREVRLIRGGKVIRRLDLYQYLLGTDQIDDLRVQTNDIIFVPPRGQTVTIRGGIRRPGAYELRDGEGLADLVRISGGLLPEAYATKAQITRLKPWQERTGGVEDRIVIDVGLAGLMGGSENPRLADADQVQVFTVLDIMRNYAIVRGSVWRPGRFELGRIETVKDLIDAAEGLRPNTFMSLAHIIRFNEDDVTTRILSVDLQKVISDPTFSLPLMARDEVILYSDDILEERDKYVIIRGAVRNPGRYPFRDGLTLKDLIPLAGGYREGAEVLQAEVSRFLPGGASSDSLVTIMRPVLPTKFLPDESSADDLNISFPLRHRDEILILTKPNFIPQQNVSITGDMKYPGVYAIQRRGERLSELLTRAGGPTTTTFLGGAEFYRRNRRVLVDFEEAFYKRNVLHDIIMMGGDSLRVPPRPHTVFVFGEVNKPGLLSFLEGDDVSDYIDRAGGLTDSSLYILLTRPTGETRKVELGLFAGDPEVSEGSIIEVTKEPPPPPPQQQGDFFGTVKDIFALLASVAAVIFIVHTTAN
ncbi:MAG: SLBB domain-containing protein, partial [Ignavibacteria bacterium]|nr:SLBB domain-containing protein [Ignavibacteria bacterium]